MSADEWRICPKCLAKLRAAKQDRLLEVQASYGVIPPEQFIADLAEAQAMPEAITREQDYTLMVYRHLYIDEEDGEFSVYYDADCQGCSYSFKFVHKEDTLRVSAEHRA